MKQVIKFMLLRQFLISSSLLLANPPPPMPLCRELELFDGMDGEGELLKQMKQVASFFSSDLKSASPSVMNDADRILTILQHGTGKYNLQPHELTYFIAKEPTLQTYMEVATHMTTLFPRVRELALTQQLFADGKNAEALRDLVATLAEINVQTPSVENALSHYLATFEVMMTQPKETRDSYAALLLVAAGDLKKEYNLVVFAPNDLVEYVNAETDNKVPKLLGLIDNINSSSIKFDHLNSFAVQLLSGRIDMLIRYYAIRMQIDEKSWREKNFAEATKNANWKNLETAERLVQIGLRLPRNNHTEAWETLAPHLQLILTHKK